MTARKARNYTLVPVGDRTYHFKPNGCDEYTATIKFFPENGFMYRWGVRAYGTNDAWRNRSSQRECLALAEKQFMVPRETSTPKGGTA